MQKLTKIKEIEKARVNVCGRQQENQGWESNINANYMAQIELAKNKQESLMKKQKIDSFLNNTRINASKIYKIKNEKKQEEIELKKIQLEKQKLLKQKYTIIQKKEKNELTKEKVVIQNKKQGNFNQKKINWKIAQIIEPMRDRIPQESDAESEISGYDSDIQVSKNQNPEQILKFREKIKSAMLQKKKI